MKFEKRYKDCYVSLTAGQLTVGNAAVERVWDMTGGRPEVLSLQNKRTGRQWAATGECGQWVEFPAEKKDAFFRRGLTDGSMSVEGIEASEDDDLGVGEKHLHVAVKLAFPACEVDWMHLVYPGLPVLRSFLRVTATGNAPQDERPEEWPADYTDCLPMKVEHCRWKSVCFHDKTDDRDNLVDETRGIFTKRERCRLQGNLLFAEDYFAHEGLTLVKEGPTPEGYLPGVDRDFETVGMNLFTAGWGFDAETLQRAGTLETYGCAVILWEGGEEDALRALHSYHRAVRPFKEKRDAFIMSNTWGDGNADGRICEDFLMRELRAAKELGVTCLQIDDGWERGVTMNSVRSTEKDGVIWSEGYYKSDPEFWAINPDRLPHGLEPLVSFAKENNIALGLWFSPDSQNSFENWERDSEVLLGLHRRYGITAFKMDGLLFRSKLSEDNFVKLMRRVTAESGGKVVFNLDTTAQVRNGYFGRVQYGTLFLENRFTGPFGRWPNYWPHRTLRNLWTLSRYYPTERLQIELLNVKKNREQYGDDPLSPAACGMEYAFAAAMFASPLVWMELTGLDTESSAALQKTMSAYRDVQADILSGHILPIGEEPDGVNWTGFQSVKEDGEGYLLLFRELEEESSHTYQLWELKSRTLGLASILGGGIQRSAEVNKDGKAEFSLDAPMSFALYRYTSNG